jgi:hypothetical protein
VIHWLSGSGAGNHRAMVEISRIRGEEGVCLRPSSSSPVPDRPGEVIDTDRILLSSRARFVGARSGTMPGFPALPRRNFAFFREAGRLALLMP